MQKLERIIIYFAIALALGMSLRSGAGFGTSVSAGQEDGGDHAIAVCAVTAVMDELMDTDRYAPDRTDFERDTREKIMGDSLSRLGELENRIKGLDRKSDDFARARDEYFRLQREASQLQQQVRAKVEQKIAEQLIECRGLVLASARAVAEDLGYDYVIASEDADGEYDPASVRDLVIDFLSRVVMVHPEDADITEDVRSDLKLP